ncbi:MAG: DUF5011 domain-containing protein, partial [Candidatus Hydrogenedentes bacterium]|nr:DUF5011 domain-containing protein [Candidatus Hydrogenedentota bacterium]
MKWLLIAAMVGGVMFTATGNDFLNDYPEQDYSITSNHKVVEVECGDFFDPPTLTAWDACDGEITEDIITGGDFVLTDLVGEYVITYNVFDSAENPSEEATRTVQVIDTSPPLITLFGENPALAALGEAYTDSGANAFDACDGDLTERMLLDNTVDVTVIGQYTITYNVEDAAGNAASEAIRRVHVSDDMPDASPLSDIVLLEGMYYEWDGNVENESDVNDFQWYRHNG